MYPTIMDKLQSMEQAHQIKILYAIESGSRGWGFPSKDSDYDVRFIYVRPTEWYLSIDDKPDYIEYPISDLLDINGWDIKKALFLFKKSNPPLFEWLSSPIVYLDQFTFGQKLRDLMPSYFSPVSTLYHYLHLAKKSFNQIMSTDQVKIKKYFYILRPILACMWIEKNGTMPPMEFHKLMANQELELTLTDEINKLLSKKIAALEIDLEPKSPIIIGFLKSKIDYYEQYLKNVRKEESLDYDSLNHLFRETLKEVWE